MEIFTVSLFGHRRISNTLIVENALSDAVRNLVINKEYVEFLVGRDGDFDILAASVVKRCQREIRDDNSNLIWVLPYLTSEYRKNEVAYRSYYDEIEVFPNAGHYKSAFQSRNRFMIDRSDLVLCCIERDSGGAFQSVRYAERMGDNQCCCFHRTNRGRIGAGSPIRPRHDTVDASILFFHEIAHPIYRTIVRR